MDAKRTLTLDHLVVPIEGERNLLELARKAGVDIPTFCYHSQLSIYGACRLCLVEIQGRGIVASCSVIPEPGMVVRTHTEEIRQMRRSPWNCCWPITSRPAQPAPRALLRAAAVDAPAGRGPGALQADAPGQAD